MGKHTWQWEKEPMGMDAANVDNPSQSEGDWFMAHQSELMIFCV